MSVRKRAIVSGAVQGVGFRYSAVAEAERHGISGWVRNNPDGTVEAEIEGDPEAVERMLDWLRHGPPGSRVAQVVVEDVPVVGEPGFVIRTASWPRG
jgi:acylphosphatase